MKRALGEAFADPQKRPGEKFRLRQMHFLAQRIAAAKSAHEDLGKTRDHRGFEAKAKILNQARQLLTTGANWAGGIEDFRIVVDKGAPDKLVSFCGQGVKKISPTQFEIHTTNFVPKTNFDVLILTKSQNN